MRILVAALPGSGKTTIMRLVKKRLPHVKIVNIGGMIYNMARKRLKVRNRDELRKKLSLSQQFKFQLEVAKKIGKMKGDIIMDSHTAVKTPEGFIPGISQKNAKYLRPDVIVLLEYRPKDILERRKKDKSRQRDNETVGQIEMHQQVSREFGLEAAEMTEASVKIIDLRYPQRRKFQHARVAANEIVKLFKNKGRV
jgi:adenylate kinase